MVDYVEMRRQVAEIRSAAAAAALQEVDEIVLYVEYTYITKKYNSVTPPIYEKATMNMHCMISANIVSAINASVMTRIFTLMYYENNESYDEIPCDIKVSVRPLVGTSLSLECPIDKVPCSRRASDIIQIEMNPETGELFSTGFHLMQDYACNYPTMGLQFIHLYKDCDCAMYRKNQGL
jgi:hypothetical protein